MTDHFVEFCYSKNGGHTYSNWRKRSLGAVGEYEKRIRFLRLGMARGWVFKWRVSSPVKRDCLGAVAQMEGMDG